MTHQGANAADLVAGPDEVSGQRDRRSVSRATGSYSLLIVSAIPVFGDPASGCRALDLWARDLSFQAKVTPDCCVVCPVEPLQARPENSVTLHKSVRIVPDDDVTSPRAAEALIEGYDVVQISGGRTARDSKTQTLFANAADTSGKLLVMGISSDRAATTRINSRDQGLVKRMKSSWRARSIEKTLMDLSQLSDGIFLCGGALVDLVHPTQKEIHVGMPSWISESDFISPDNLQQKLAEAEQSETLRLCVACRLEPMKGVHIAVEALRKLSELPFNLQASLAVLGEGAERNRLEALSKDLGIDDSVTFEGSYGYPTAFFDKIRNYHFMVLTNLNREQPRLVFDAISQGMIPVCPDTPPYTDLGIHPDLYYRCGSPESLAETLFNIKKRGNFSELMTSLMGNSFTIESMHQKRADWINSLLLEPLSPWGPL